jgi:hypothetical protein
VRSRWALGAIAITAIIVAAISFAVVDISTSAASGCLDAGAPCTERSTPELAAVAAVVGALALLLAVITGITWIVRDLATRREVRQTDVDYSRRPTARVRDDEDDPLSAP